jgi:signal transduction histidine kinase
LSLFVLLFLKKRLELQRQQLTSAKKLIQAEENEKAKIGRDLHDLTGHQILGLSGHLENLEFPDPASKGETLRMLEEIEDSIRELSHRMKSTWLERFTLVKSLAGLCKDVNKMTGLDIEFHSPSASPVIPEETKIHLFRIVEELLSNAVKHAPGSKVLLEISFTPKNLTLVYNDNGPGFSKVKVFDNGIGMSNLMERIKLLKGEVDLDTQPGFGTHYSITVPLNQ